MRAVSIDREDEWFVISDGETEVTSPVMPILESLLLADALIAFRNCAADPLGTASEVSAPRNESKEEPDDGR